jgi:hypothetical protein
MPSFAKKHLLAISINEVEKNFFVLICFKFFCSEISLDIFWQTKQTSRSCFSLSRAQTFKKTRVRRHLTERLTSARGYALLPPNIIIIFQLLSFPSFEVNFAVPIISRKTLASFQRKTNVFCPLKQTKLKCI